MASSMGRDTPESDTRSSNSIPLHANQTVRAYCQPVSDKEKSVVSFLIDDTPSAEQASKTFNDDYELNFQDFLERTVDERAAEDFFIPIME